jgi:hypothetical protein
MKHLQIAILAIVCLSTPALAQGRSPQYRAQLNDFDGYTQGGLVPDPNQCAPTYAQPVWGPNSTLQGYSCSNYANGS